MRARLARVAAENAIPAIVAAQIGEREEHFAGIADYRRFEPVFYFDGCGKKRRQVTVFNAEQLAGKVARGRRAAT